MGEFTTIVEVSAREIQKKKGILKDELFTYEGNKKIKTIAITNYTVLDSNNSKLI